MNRVAFLFGKFVKVGSLNPLKPAGQNVLKSNLTFSILVD